MGKKVKKDDKSAPVDVFEPVQIDAKEAKTGVLLLKSEEEDVVAKAALSLYKFADKGDENKITLLELDAVTEFLKLILHPDPIVKRNSMMALGTMATHPTVRRKLRLSTDATSSIVNLLSAEEVTVVHEFASLCVCAMANEYTSKAEIIQCGGIEHLVRLLLSPDPDVQKNSIEALTLLSLDYSACKVIREAQGLPNILELLKSEYPVIQHLALVCLERVAAEPATRNELREMEVASTLVNLVGMPEHHDLHVFAISTLSTMLVDIPTANKMLENNALKRLIAFIEDALPPEDESGSGGKETAKGKKGGKGGAADGRNSKKGKKKEKGDRVDSAMTPSATQPVIPTLPHVKEHAARVLARASQSNEEVRRILHEAQVEKLFIALLSNEISTVQISGAQGLSAMAESLVSRQSAGEWGAIELLAKLICNDKVDVREAASIALSRLTLATPGNCTIAVKHCVDSLVKLLMDVNSTESTLCSAATTITNVCKDDKVRSEFINHGAMTALINRLKSPSCAVQSRCAHCLASLSADEEARLKFRNENQAENLFALINSNDDEVRRAACWAVSILAQDDEIAKSFGGMGAVDVLHEIVLSKSRKNAFTESALNNLLRHYLPAKYAITDRLEMDDFIKDGFYDVGKKGKSAKPQIMCPTLAVFLRQVISADNRAIILLNSVPNKPPTPPPSEDLANVGGLNSESKMNIRGAGKKGKESKLAKGKQRTQQQQQQYHQQQQQQLQTPNKEEDEIDPVHGESTSSTSDPEAPGDDNLCRYLEEIQSKISPLPSAKDQITALARYVSDCMGGEVDNSEHISWELSLNTLRQQLHSNVIPIGLIQKGIYHHRALLFKFLADRLCLKCSLHRAEYNRCWNEVALLNENDNEGRYPPVLYVVDLMHLPGRLMKVNSVDANNYVSLP